MELERPSNSALVRRLREAARGKPRSLGFGRDRDDKPAPAIVLVAQVAGLDPAAARKAVVDGAAAVLFALEGAASDHVGRDGAAAVEACGDAVAGLSVTGAFDAEAVAKAGFDFVVVNVASAPADVLTAEGLAKVARVEEASQTTGLLRALGELQVDAVLAGGTGAGTLTLLDLMGYRHVVDCMRQPVLMIADGSVQPENLQALRDVGIVGVVLPEPSRLAAFREAAAKVKATRAAGASGAMAVLPRLGTPPAAEADREDEGDDDE
jgi:hypothetical protein